MAASPLQVFTGSKHAVERKRAAATNNDSSQQSNGQQVVFVALAAAGPRPIHEEPWIQMIGEWRDDHHAQQAERSDRCPILDCTVQDHALDGTHVELWLACAFSTLAMRVHIGAQQRIHAGLIAASLGTKPPNDI